MSGTRYCGEDDETCCKAEKPSHGKGKCNRIEAAITTIDFETFYSHVVILDLDPIVLRDFAASFCLFQTSLDSSQAGLLFSFGISRVPEHAFLANQLVRHSFYGMKLFDGLHFFA